MLLRSNYARTSKPKPKVTKHTLRENARTQIKKKYVSFYLMPVYVNPKLLERISTGLKKRMQGKSCFNFKTIDKQLMDELAGLTKKGFEIYKKEKML